VLLGRFRIEKVLGRGGMGEVLLAHDTLLHRRVALKRLRPDGAHGAADADSRRSAILREARRASQVSDRRIAAIHDVVELGDDVLRPCASVCASRCCWSCSGSSPASVSGRSARRMRRASSTATSSPRT
jgi:serine/threonine protein kinase